jgi:hypothetical protein
MPLHPLAPTNYENEKWGVRIAGPQAQPSGSIITRGDSETNINGSYQVAASGVI